ncbi:MAG: trehalose-phosphatase [Candidatus Competibacter denitrificans]
MASVRDTLVERMTEVYWRGQRLLLVFDYDGTLTPFAARPELARLDPALRGVLARLAALPRLALGVVSGRDLADLTAMVGLPGLYYGGTWGLELDLRGERLIPVDSPAARHLVKQLIALLETRVTAYPGAWVEKKALGLTVHYRQVCAEHSAAAHEDFMALLRPYAESVQLFQAPLAIEVLPALGVDKGTALQAIIAHSHCCQADGVLYAGDGLNDAAALAVAAAIGGIALGIGPEPPTAATHRLADYRELTALLAQLAATLTTLRASA